MYVCLLYVVFLHIHALKKCKLIFFKLKFNLIRNLHYGGLKNSTLFSNPGPQNSLMTQKTGIYTFWYS